MSSALIGHTGFVGGNLLACHEFDECYNSRNYEEMRGKHFGPVVCAGVSAVKWLANKEPQTDRAQIAALEDVLASVTADRFVLISTIDVYPELSGLDESFDCHSRPNHTYGTHRLAFEDFCREHFERCFVTRLPALFGPGLKKNVIYDLLHAQLLDTINPACSFQYYDTTRLWGDLQRQVAADLRLMNLFSEPVPTQTILDRYFPDKTVGQNAAGELHYDLHTRHANVWDKDGPYVYSANEVLAQLGTFIARYRERAE